MENIDIKAGQLIMLSSGQYSDFGYNGHFVALENIDRGKVDHIKRIVEDRYKKSNDAYEKWAETRQGEYPGVIDRHETFIAEMIRCGLVLSLDVRELYLGSYGDLDL